VILDKVPVIDFDPDLQTQAVGILDIRSVYDFDGTTRNTGTGTPSIGTLANPSLRTADQRPARFLRIEKPVSIGDDDLGFPDIDNAAFGTVNFMREILGYVPIEPDGSVSVRVPTSVAFVISILDKDGVAVPRAPQLAQIAPANVQVQLQAATGGRRISRMAATHQRGMDRRQQHPLPGTVATFSANTGETMAQLKARTTCVPGNTCSQLPSVNLNFVDDWTDPAVRRMPRSPTRMAAPACERWPHQRRRQSAWNASAASSSTTRSRSIRCGTSIARFATPTTTRSSLADHTCGLPPPSIRPTTRRACRWAAGSGRWRLNQQALHKAATANCCSPATSWNWWAVRLCGVVTTIDPRRTACADDTAGAGLAGCDIRRGSTRFFSRFATGGTSGIFPGEN
jgi:hypothetical protein